jgi:phenylpropionate dioxygenase-like ring-hydroxylating dioxygenase large terminal subunit
MPDSAALAESWEQRLNTGLLNLWYPVAPSWQVANEPVGVTRLSRNIAFWRDRAGQIQAIEDRCPHRGARLSLGWNLGERVACRYHGVEVDGAGKVVDVPAVEHCPMKGETRVHAYPAVERHGAIFLWFGDGKTEPAPLTLPEQLAGEDYSSFLCTAKWRCNYRYAIDNVMDPMHGAYLHAASHSMAEGDKQARMRLRKTEMGFIFEKEDQSGVNFDWTEFGDTGAHWLRLAIPYRRNAGPGGMFWIIGIVTPVTATICQVFFWRCRQVQGWQRDSWRFMYRNRLEGRHWEVLEQDRVVLEEMADDAREHEFLYQHDTGLARLRRMMESAAKAQVGAALRA